MTWYLQADDEPEKFAGDTPVDGGESQRDTHENVFKEEHDALINSDAVVKEKASRENLRRFVESEVERIRPRQEQYEAQQAAREASRADARQKAKDRLAAARAASEEQKAKRDAERTEREASLKDQAAAKSNREQGTKSKTGGSDKSYTALAKARILLERAKDMVNTAYEKKRSEGEEIEKEIKDIETRLRHIKEEIADGRRDLSGTRDIYRRGLSEERPDAKKRFEESKKEMLQAEQKLRFEESSQKRSQLRLRAQLQKVSYTEKELKKLVDKVERARLNRSDPIGELLQMEPELRRNRVNLPLGDLARQQALVRQYKTLYGEDAAA